MASSIGHTIPTSSLLVKVGGRTDGLRTDSLRTDGLPPERQVPMGCCSFAWLSFY